MEGITKNNRSATKSMTLTAAISMGVGAMVGAGIFALMGEAGAGAGSAVYISFILGGIVSLLSAYSYAKLGVRYPSSGGIVEYLVRGYGSGYITGIVSLILYFSVVVVMGMVAKAFGAYAVALVARSSSELWVNVFASTMVLSLTLINFIGSNVVGRVEKFIVIAKLLILGIFIVTGLILLKSQLLSFDSGTSRPLDVLSTVAICLLAYHGFGVITNTVDDMADPSTALPRALYGAIGIVMIVYVGAALAVFGNLPLSEILRAKDYAMAEAARPIFGHAGFTVISIAALMSAASSVNANLYSTAKMTFLLAKDGELPHFETKQLWRAGTGGLLTTAALVLLVANLLDLSRIASLGSIVYLIVYSTVHLGHLIKLTSETGASKALVGLAFVTNFTILLIFGFQTARNDSCILYILTFLVLVCVVIEVYMQKVRNRIIKPCGTPH
jgi:amino acid transporter